MVSDAETRVIAEPEERPTSGATAVTRARAVVAKFGSAWIVFTLLAVVFGAIFSVLTPAFWGHDELTQFGRAYQVSDGGFLPTEIDDDRGVSYGGTVPATIHRAMNLAFDDYTNNPPEPAPMVQDESKYDAVLSAPVEGPDETVWFTNTAAYSPVPYIPAALGIKIAQGLNLDVGGLNLLTRLAGLAAYVVVVAFGLRALRHHRIQWLAFTVALLPIAAFQAGTITADTLTNAVALLMSALIVKGLFLGVQLNKVETGALLASVIALPLCKPTYVLLAMLVLVIPTANLALGRRLRWLPALFTAVGVALFLAWTKISSPTTEGMGLMRTQQYWHSVVPGDQMKGVLQHPFHFLEVAFDSVMRRDQEWFTEFFGKLGFAYVTVPALSIVACIVALVLSFGIAERFDASHRRVAIVAVAVVASIAMIYGTLYLSFTPVGYFIIDGVQGRYFVPLAIVAAAVLLRWIPLRFQADPTGRTDRTGRGTVIAIVAATVISLTAATLKYATIVY